MRCPFCGHEDSQVKDSRPTEDGAAIRRRRQCEGCAARFTTFERIQLRELTVIKGDGRREPFERDKLLRSLAIAARKRPVFLLMFVQVSSAELLQYGDLSRHSKPKRQPEVRVQRGLRL